MMPQKIVLLTAMVLTGVLFVTDSVSTAYAEDSAIEKSSLPLHAAYHRVLPLSGGSNFRDLGGYLTDSGKRVVRGKLFRSGVMSSLTNEDQLYLNQYDFKTVVDLRSSEEIALFPNHWAKESDIDFLSVDYDIVRLTEDLIKKHGGRPSMEQGYPEMSKMIAPQLKLLFERLVDEQVPLVVNCSAGQDRTGIASALLLSVLGVPREVIIEDYMLSSDFRRPENELIGLDEQTAQDSEFMQMALRYQPEGEHTRAQPLKTSDGTPYLVYALNAIESEYGSTNAYVVNALGIDQNDLNRLRTLYLE